MTRPAGPAADSLLLAGAKLASVAAGMLTAKILAVALSLEQYGAYAQAITVASLLAALTGCGLSDCVNYWYNRGDRRRVETAFLLELLLDTGAMLLVWACRGGLAAAFSSPGLAALLWLAGLRPLLSNRLQMYQALLVSAGRARLLAARSLLTAVGKLLGAVAAARWGDARWALLGLVLADAAQLAAFHRSACRQALPVRFWRGALRLAPQLLAYGVPVGIYAVTGVLARDLDKFVVSCLAAPSAVGLYANCSRILPLDLFAAALASVLLPRITRALARGDRKRAAGLLGGCLRAGWYTVWPLGCAVLLTADQLLPALYSPAYLPGKPIFILYILDSMLRFAGMHLALTAAGKTRRLMAISLLALALNGVLDPLLYFGWGLAGPAAATLCSSAVYTALILRATRQELQVRWSEMFDWKEPAALAAALLLTGGLCLALKQALLLAGLGEPAVLAGTAGGFLLLNLALGRKKIVGMVRALAQWETETREPPI